MEFLSELEERSWKLTLLIKRHDLLRQRVLTLSAQFLVCADQDEREALFGETKSACDLRKANAKFLRAAAEAMARMAEEIDD